MKFLRRFNSSDRDAAIVLALVIIVSIVLFPHLSEQDKEVSSVNCQLSTVNCQLFKFDPNTATESQLLSLGLSQREVRNILKYRARGGRYRVKEDFARVYGLTLEKYRQLEPYIAIKPQIMAADVIKREKNSPHPSSLSPHPSSLSPHPSSLNPQPSAVGLRASRKLRYGETVDINSADTAMLKRIPGIGDYYAMRIVELRKRKQVFSSPEELLAIRNFPETALTYMTASQDFPLVTETTCLSSASQLHPGARHHFSPPPLGAHHICHGPCCPPVFLSCTHRENYSAAEILIIDN